MLCSQHMRASKSHRPNNSQEQILGYNDLTGTHLVLAVTTCPVVVTYGTKEDCPK